MSPPLSYTSQYASANQSTYEDVSSSPPTSPESLQEFKGLQTFTGIPVEIPYPFWNQPIVDQKEPPASEGSTSPPSVFAGVAAQQQLHVSSALNSENGSNGENGNLKIKIKIPKDIEAKPSSSKAKKRPNNSQESSSTVPKIHRNDEKELRDARDRIITLFFTDNPKACGSDPRLAELIKDYPKVSWNWINTIRNKNGVSSTKNFNETNATSLPTGIHYPKILSNEINKFIIDNWKTSKTQIELTINLNKHIKKLHENGKLDREWVIMRQSVGRTIGKLKSKGKLID